VQESVAGGLDAAFAGKHRACGNVLPGAIDYCRRARSV
jgi:hypothetical protein